MRLLVIWAATLLFSSASMAQTGEEAIGEEAIGATGQAKPGYVFKGMTHPDRVSRNFSACKTLEAAKMLANGETTDAGVCEDFFLAHIMSCEVVYVGKNANVFFSEVIHQLGNLPIKFHIVSVDLKIEGNAYSAQCRPELKPITLD